MQIKKISSYIVDVYNGLLGKFIRRVIEKNEKVFANLDESFNDLLVLRLYFMLGKHTHVFSRGYIRLDETFTKFIGLYAINSRYIYLSFYIFEKRLVNPISFRKFYQIFFFKMNYLS